MNAGDAAGKEGRGRSNSGMSVDYVRDGALAAHKKMSGSLLNKLGITRASPEPSPKSSPISPGAANGAASAAASRAAMSATTTPKKGIFGGSGTGPVTPSLGGGGGGGGTTAAAATVAAGQQQHYQYHHGHVPSLPPTIITTTTAATTNRSRKGSLRKNILQRGSLQRMETILSPRAVSQFSDRTDSSGASSITSPTSPEIGGDEGGGKEEEEEEEDDYPTPRVSYDKGSRTLSLVEPGRVHGAAAAAVQRDGLLLDSGLANSAASLSRSSTLRDNNSTTDEDEKPPGSSSSNASSDLMMAVKRPSIITDSYFPPQPAIPPSIRRRSPLKAKTTKSSPLSAIPLDAAASAAPLSPEIWDYAETEWWGWIILFVTWISFVVGMGSCFGAWSWAWDVGETPYAPPELEDDPTLPIVGYYPALIVLTGVMAWVWVIIAWVGMKYFKHAKMSGDEG